jgi:cyclopropane-fatty-acyl-phospholipid synthase
MAAIQHHYDVSNEFFALWLDRSLTYSCALWSGDEDLADAQASKLEWHLTRCVDLVGTRLLDVGCGWGSLLQRAVERHGVRQAVGLTKSAAQANWIEDLRLPNIVVRLEGWQDHQTEEPYDAIVSIGAFEHFAHHGQSRIDKLAGYRRFFRFCHHNLKPGGTLCLQSITYEDTDATEFSEFFADAIFPESDLPHSFEILEAARDAFEIVEVRMDREHYARTARSWLRRLKANRGAAVSVVGANVVRRFEKYLSLLVIGFHVGSMNLARIVMRCKDEKRVRWR